MPPLLWNWTRFVWSYALTGFLINDRVKLMAYRIFDRTPSGLLRCAGECMLSLYGLM